MLDRILANGGSAVAAVDKLKRCGARRIEFLGNIAAPERVQPLRTAQADVPIFLAAIDSHLDANRSREDRQFGTV